MTTKTTENGIVTHVSPDADALAAAWLASRHIAYEIGDESDAPIVLIPAGTPAPSDAYAVVDCGGIYDAKALRFDHHQFPGKQASTTSATELVFQSYSGHVRTPHLTALVEAVTDGDGRNFRGELAQWSFPTACTP